MDEALKSYLAATHPKPFRILGHRLRPFSVGHHTLLAALHNRFVTGDEAPGLPDILLGVFVCSRSATEAARGLSGWDYSRFLWRVRALLWMRRRMIWMRLLPLAAVSIDTMVGAFSDYILENSRCPEIIDDGEAHGRRTPGTPFLQLVKLTLLSKLNHSPAEALDKPWGEALHDCAGYWEMAGTTKVASAEDIDLHAQHLELLERFAEQIEKLEKEAGYGTD